MAATGESPIASGGICDEDPGEIDGNMETEKRKKTKMKQWYDKSARDDPPVLVLLPEDSTGMKAQWHGP